MANRYLAIAAPSSNDVAIKGMNLAVVIVAQSILRPSLANDQPPWRDEADVKGEA